MHLYQATIKISGIIKLQESRIAESDLIEAIWKTYKGMRPRDVLMLADAKGGIYTDPPFQLHVSSA